MSLSTDDMIQELRVQAGGLNWLDDEPDPSHFKALKGFFYEGGVLIAENGYSVITTQDASPKFAGVSRFRTNGSDTEPSKLEYALFLNIGVPYAMKLSGTYTGTLATMTPTEILDLASTSIAISNATSQISEEVEIVQVGEKALCFVGSGISLDGRLKNLVLENDASVTADFSARGMGINAPSLRPTTLGQGSGDLTTKWRYLWSWIRKDANGKLLSQSGGNSMDSITVLPAGPFYSEADVEDKTHIYVALTGTGTTTGDAQVNGARLWRTRNLNDEDFSKTIYYSRHDFDVTDIGGGVLAVSGTLNDSMSDEELWDRSSTTTLQPRTGQYDVPLPACKHACYGGGRMWCSDGSNIYYTSGEHSGAGLETYDPAYSFLPADYDGQKVRAMFFKENNVVVVKDSTTGIILNADPANAIQWTDTQIGSMYKTSIVDTPYGVMGLTNKGLMIHNGMRWSNQNLSKTVLKINENDETKRIRPPYELETYFPRVTAFWYDGRYHVKVNGESGGAGVQTATLVYDPEFGWSQSGNTWDWALTYENDAKVIGFNNLVGTAFVNLQNGDDYNGTDMSGVIQHGPLRATSGAYEFDEAEIIGKFSSAISMSVKLPDGIHAQQAAILPTPIRGLMNRKFRGMVDGWTEGPHLSMKLKGTILPGDYFKAMTVKRRQIEDYGKTGKYTASMLGRYDCEHYSAPTLPDVSGCGIDLTFTWSGTAEDDPALQTETGSVARGIGLKTYDPEVLDFKLVNATGYEIDPLSEFSIMFSVEIPGAGLSADTILFENYTNSRKIALEYLYATDKFKLTVGRDAHVYDGVCSIGDRQIVTLVYKYQTGNYDDSEADNFTFKSTLYLDKTSYSGSTGTASSISGTGCSWFVSNEEDIKFDELRVYSRALTDAEVLGLYDEFYNSDDKDPEYF